MRYSRKPRRAADKWTLSYTSAKCNQSCWNPKEHQEKVVAEATAVVAATEVVVATAAEVAVVATAAEAAVVAMVVEAAVAVATAVAEVAAAMAEAVAAATVVVEADHHTKADRESRSITNRYDWRETNIIGSAFVDFSSAIQAQLLFELSIF
jgi:hypothetical protein